MNGSSSISRVVLQCLQWALGYERKRAHKTFSFGPETNAIKEIWHSKTTSIKRRAKLSKSFLKIAIPWFLVNLFIVAFLREFLDKKCTGFFLILCFYLSRNFHTHIIQARAFYRNSFTFIRNSVCFFFISKHGW